VHKQVFSALRPDFFDSVGAQEGHGAAKDRTGTCTTGNYTDGTEYVWERS